MANGQPPRFSPPELRDLANRRSIDPTDMPTQGGDLPIQWPVETAEVELLPTTTEAQLPAVPPLGPPSRRRRSPIPILTADQAKERRRRSAARWFLSLGVAALGLGLAGGIGFAVAAVFIQPEGAERWLDDAAQWVESLGAPPSVQVEGEGLNVQVEEGVPTAAPPAPLPGTLREAAEADGVEAPIDEATVEEVIEEEPVVEPEPEPVVRPRPRRRFVPRPTPVAGPKPVPMVKPYADRPVPVPGASPPVNDDGLLEQR